jgi:hypothetical protein
LPSGIRVSVVEKTPYALVELESGQALFDEKGALIAPATKLETDLPIAISGWDETRSPKADKENLQRISMYRAMLTEWKQKGLLERVVTVNMKDIRDPIVVAEDSGRKVAIAVGRDNFGENLKNGIIAISGKGVTFEGVSLYGSNLRLVPREAK